ncbi:hypothetical protein PFISCL1PPCAC_27101, partial [Pristionchus fissidentatus]
LQKLNKLDHNGKLPLDFAVRVFTQIIEGSAFLIDRLKIVHGLIEPRSIEFCSDRFIRTAQGHHLPVTPRIILTDLGNSFPIDSRDENRDAYSMQYKPPEIALGLNVRKSSDIWACACVLYEMFFGKPLFNTA